VQVSLRKSERPANGARLPDASVVHSPFPGRRVALYGAVLLALVVGVVLRVAWLGSVPAGFNQDEALRGYEAYSLLTTGRDLNGKSLPLVMEGFEDFHAALFDYSLVPLVRVFGLKPSTVRLGAGVWGIVDLVFIAILGGLIGGMPGAALGAFLGALSPWHLPISRFGAEPILASAMVSGAMMCFLLWNSERRGRWLTLSALFLGLSLYSYAITKAFVPLMIAWIVLLYRRELKRALPALGLVLAFAVPLAIITLNHPVQMQAHFLDISVFANARSLSAGLSGFAAGFASYFSPAALFYSGFFDGPLLVNFKLFHLAGFGQLFPEQIPLILLSAVAFFEARRRRIALLLLGWLVCATVPAALVHPALLHSVLAIVPWLLLTVLGFSVLCDWISRSRAVAVFAAAIVAAIVLHGTWFAYSYFHDFAAVASHEPEFQYGMAEMVGDISRLDDGSEPIVISPDVNQAYIYILFFQKYPPASFQHDQEHGRVVRVIEPSGLLGPIVKFDRYYFYPPQAIYPQFAHGIFVFTAHETVLSLSTAAVVRYPDGDIAYRIVVK
jgi:hypothetical protein